MSSPNTYAGILKAVRPILREIVAANTLPGKMLIVSEYGQVSAMINDIIAGLAISEDEWDSSAALEEFDVAIAQLESYFTNDSGEGMPSA